MARVNEEDLSQHLITCLVCYVQFNDEENKPKLLSCGHAVCLQCLKVLEHLTETFKTFTHSSNNRKSLNMDLYHVLFVATITVVTKVLTNCQPVSMSCISLNWISNCDCNDGLPTTKRCFYFATSFKRNS